MPSAARYDREYNTAYKLAFNRECKRRLFADYGVEPHLYSKRCPVCRNMNTNFREDSVCMACVLKEQSPAVGVLPRTS